VLLLPLTVVGRDARSQLAHAAHDEGEVHLHLSRRKHHAELRASI
jgi:hypothetical protein